MNIIITGPKQCGKTTIISKILHSFSGSVSGFVTGFESRASVHRELFMRSIDSSQTRIAVKWINGKPEIYHEVFDSFAPSLIDESSDLIIIDELGKFEKDSVEMKTRIESALSSPTNLVAVIRLDAISWMQDIKFRDDIIMFTVDEENRDSLAEIIVLLLHSD